MNNNRLYNNIIHNISNAVKTVLNEEIQNFDVTEYDNDSHDIISHQDIIDISYSCPKTKEELVDIIVSRFLKCDFTQQVIEPDMTGIDLKHLQDLSDLFRFVFNDKRINETFTDIKVNLDLSSWNITNIFNLSYIFSYDCKQLQSINLAGWDTSNVKDMDHMFYGCESLIDLNMSGWDTSSVTNMCAMFENCHKLQSLDLSRWETSKVTNMSWMFCDSRSLTNINLSGWDTSNVTDMSCMFWRCNNLIKLDLTSFDTSNVKDMNHMFYGCESLKFLDISSFSAKSLLKRGMNEIFINSNITQLKISKDLFHALNGYYIDFVKVI